ncbi:MAG: N-6 DNA methylase [Bacteriovoracaceae bacterium]|nr:N-6 DNA methylase [Bacteriovoracaceae bacterium]
MENTGTFFIIVPVNFELHAQVELTEKLKFHYPELIEYSMELIRGGIELELPLEIGFALNHILKIPTRILMRITNFKCRDYPKLFNKLKKIEWRKYLIGQIPKVDCSAAHSRVMNTKRVKETVHSSIKNYYKANTPKKESPEVLDSVHTVVFVRLEDDQCTVSMDTSGDRLNIRGKRKLIGEAPIRETLAAGILFSLRDKISKVENLIDPMCGAGTILIEARDFYTSNYNRSFSYQFFPIHNKNEAKLLTSMDKSLCQNLLGLDIDKKMVEIAKSNMDDTVSIQRRDASEVYEVNLNSCGIVINPPYGQRIVPDNKLDRFYSQVIRALSKSYDPQFIAMIVPTALQMRKIEIPKGRVLTEVMKFKNGGFNVRLISVNKLS